MDEKQQFAEWTNQAILQQRLRDEGMVVIDLSNGAPRGAWRAFTPNDAAQHIVWLSEQLAEARLEVDYLHSKLVLLTTKKTTWREVWQWIGQWTGR